MSKIKLVAIDLDGTFLSSQTELIEENVQAIQAAQKLGVEIVICTGRTYPGVKRFVDRMPFMQKEGFMILHNGAVTLETPSLKVVQEFTIANPERQASIDFMRQQNGLETQLVAIDEDMIYLLDSQEANSYVVYDAKTLETPIKPLEVSELMEIEGITKMLLMGPPEELDVLQANLPKGIQENCSVVRSQPVILEIFAKFVNKGQAVKKLAEHLKVKPEEVMTLGDQLNDLEMLKYAGHGIAMGNAHPELLAHAKYVTGTNDQAGVAEAIRKYILNSREF